MSVKAIYSSEVRVDNQANAEVNKSDLAARMKRLALASGNIMFDTLKHPVQICATTVAQQPLLNSNASELLANIYALKVDDPKFDAKVKLYSEALLLN